MIAQPSLAFVRLTVYKRHARTQALGSTVGHVLGSVRVPIAYETIPLSCLRSGLRSVPLRSPMCGSRIGQCALLIETFREVDVPVVSIPAACAAATIATAVAPAGAPLAVWRTRMQRPGLRMRWLGAMMRAQPIHHARNSGP